MTWPAETPRVPASIASRVDLPAPLGPISPVSVPRRTTSDTPATARTPPNTRVTSMAWSTTAPSSAWSLCTPTGAGPRGSFALSGPVEATVCANDPEGESGAGAVEAGEKVAEGAAEEAEAANEPEADKPGAAAEGKPRPGAVARE